MIAVLLDLDGTLTDPREGILACMRHALGAMGAAIPGDAELEAFIGPPLHASFATLLGGRASAAQQAVMLYRERFSAVGLYENRLYPGMADALAALERLGVAPIVATSKPTVFAERIVEHFGLGRHLRAIYGSELDGTRSDKSQLIAHVLHAERITASAAVMVGDRKHDMAGAHANGVHAIGALWGYGSRAELVEAGAAALCERPAELAAVVSTVTLAGCVHPFHRTDPEEAS